MESKHNDCEADNVEEEYIDIKNEEQIKEYVDNLNEKLVDMQKQLEKQMKFLSNIFNPTPNNNRKHKKRKK